MRWARTRAASWPAIVAFGGLPISACLHSFDDCGRWESCGSGGSAPRSRTAANGKINAPGGWGGEAGDADFPGGGAAAGGNASSSGGRAGAQNGRGGLTGLGGGGRLGGGGISVVGGVAGDSGEGGADTCAPETCEHGGTCEPVAASFTCDCAGTGYTGTACETDIDECRATPATCLNGGTCTNALGSFDCECSAGYAGARCEMEDPCGLSPCQNGGTCSNTSSGYLCSCPGFNGLNCEYRKFQAVGFLPGDDSSYLVSISADGSVAGGVSSGAGSASAVRFASGALQLLAPPAGAEPAFPCWGAAVSADGSVFGQCEGSMGRQAFRYDTSMVFLDLEPLPASHHLSSLNNVSRDGTIVVGSVATDTVNYAPFFRDPSGTTILPLASSEAFAVAVSNDGETIVGYEVVGIGMQGWRWTRSGGTSLLPVPSDYSRNEATDVSADGDTIVGVGFTDFGERILYWTGNAAPNDLGAGRANAVNADATVIVGCTLDVREAIVWSANTIRTLASVLGSTSDLDGWTETCINDVSDDGHWVVGDGRHAGRREGFIAHLP